MEDGRGVGGAGERREEAGVKEGGRTKNHGGQVWAAKGAETGGGGRLPYGVQKAVYSIAGEEWEEGQEERVGAVA